MNIPNDSQYFNQLDKVAEEVITLLSETIDVNTIFLASNVNNSNLIVKAHNRNAPLLQEGDIAPFDHSLYTQSVENESDLVVIPDFKENPLPVTVELEQGCFMSAPVYQANGEIFGTICAYDIKPYDFSVFEMRLIKTLSSLLSQSIILEDQLLHDHLTGLSNSQYLKVFFEQIKEENLQYSLLYVDLDHFKYVNDEYGHDIGDKLLKKIASLFLKIVPKDSVVARIGGDEFIFLIPVSSNEMLESSETAFRINGALSTNPIEVDGHKLAISASVGMTYAASGKSLRVLMKEADTAMYKAKRNGRSHLIVH